jgi:CRISPR-associated protein Cas2
MAEERLYLVIYDISLPKRWRRVYKIMNAYGGWIQLSAFQRRLTARRRAEMAQRLEDAVKHGEDHVLIMDLGPAEANAPRVESLGKTCEAPVRRAVVICGSAALVDLLACRRASAAAALISWAALAEPQLLEGKPVCHRRDQNRDLPVLPQEASDGASRKRPVFARPFSALRAGPPPDPHSSGLIESHASTSIPAGTASHRSCPRFTGHSGGCGLGCDELTWRAHLQP